MSSKKKLPLKVAKKSVPYFLTLFLIFLLFLTYQVWFSDRFYPGVAIGDSQVSFLTKPQAYQILSTKIGKRTQDSLNFKYQDKNFSLNLKTLNININYSGALDQAYELGHTNNPFKNLADQGKALFLKITTEPEISISFDNQIETISSAINKDPIDATLYLDAAKNIHTTNSSNGLSLDKEKLNDEIKNYLTYGVYNPDVPVKEIEANFTTQEAQAAKQALENVQDKPIKISYQEGHWSIDIATLYHLLNLSDGNSLLDPQKLENFIKEIARSIDQNVEEPLFKFDASSKKVATFRPAQDGLTLDQNQTQVLIVSSIQNQGSHNISLPVSIVKPSINTAEINTLGIKELIGRGISNFAGSIPNRVFNVGLTASKINGILVPPGSVFSFNQSVGDVSAATGFKQAYVIKDGRTTLDDGGGVCQDSTTLFRAVLNAGLPVVARTAHAYRVGYYEQGFPPGLDATVFYPSVDFKFKNDTPASILIQAYTSGTTLYVDLYGTSDGRKVELTTPIIANQTPPPPELRQDDPNLPKGTVKQVDFSAWGAQVSFKRTVKRNGEAIINETWRSNYKPWQAIFLVGTKE